MKLIYLHNVYIVREEVYRLENYNVNIFVHNLLTHKKKNPVSDAVYVTI